MPNIQVSVGELVDKWSILNIKEDKFFKLNTDKWNNVRLEMHMLEPEIKVAFSSVRVFAMYKNLLECNLRLWCIENDIRKLES